jgi:hypothetical protein
MSFILKGIAVKLLFGYSISAIRRPTNPSEPPTEPRISADKSAVRFDSNSFTKHFSLSF